MAGHTIRAFTPDHSGTYVARFSDRTGTQTRDMPIIGWAVINYTTGTECIEPIILDTFPETITSYQDSDPDTEWNGVYRTPQP